MMQVTDDAYLVFWAGGQKSALAVDAVREVARCLPLTPVPGVPPGIAGVVNLRGHVLTALHTAHLLGLRQPASAAANIIVTFDGRFYSLLADAMGDMMRLPRENIHPLDSAAPQWRGAAAKICRSPQGEVMPLVDMRIILQGLSACPARITECEIQPR